MSLPAVVAGEAPAQGAPTLRVTRRPDLAALAEKVRQLQARRRGPLQRCPTRLTELDAVLGGGFARGCIHELLAPGEATAIRSLALWAAARAVDRPAEHLSREPWLRGATGGLPASADTGRQAARGTRTRVIDGAADAFAHAIQHTADTAVPHLRNLVGWHGRVGRECAGANPNAHDPGHPRPTKWVFYLDTAGDFYPPAAIQLGLPLERLLVIRTKRNVDALWVCEQVLRCPAVAAVVLPIRAMDAYVSRRLQLAAETGGGLGFLLRSAARGGHTFAATRLRLDPLPNKDPTPCLHMLDVGTVPKGRQSIAQGASPGMRDRQRMESPGGATETRAVLDPLYRPSGAEIFQGHELRGLTPPATDCRPYGAKQPNTQPYPAMDGTHGTGWDARVGRENMGPNPNVYKNPTPCFAKDGVSVSTVCQQPDPLSGADAELDGFYATRRVQVTLLKLREGRLAEPFELILPTTAAWGTTPPQSSSTRPPSPSPRSRSPASAS